MNQKRSIAKRKRITPARNIYTHRAAMSHFKCIHAHEDENYFHRLLYQLKADLPHFNSCYSKSALGYYEQRARDDGWTITDSPYILMQESTPFFCFLGFDQCRNGVSRISAFEIPATFIESQSLRSSQKKCITSSIKEKVLVPGRELLLVDFFARQRISSATDYLLREHNFCHQLSYSRHIDLSAGEDIIRSGLRKSLGPLINWGERELDISLHTECNIEWETIRGVRELHIREAGRETRSEMTWRKQLEAILAKEAFCVTGKLHGELVSAGYFSISDKHCYYSVSVSRRDFFGKPLFHALMWRAMLHAKKMGALTFETGVDYTKSCKTAHDVSEKEIQIAKFKSGFGGYLKPSLRGILNVN